MKEVICQFGPNNGLTGVLCQPDESVRVADAPVALILNAGIIHNIGPFRLHVDIARMLADAGFASLRIDISGLGDSQTRTGKLEDTDRVLQDANDAMDHLQQQIGADQFVAIGLCSGAYNAHQVSIADSRVVGAVFFDGIVFRTPGFYLRHYSRFANPRFWRNAIKRRTSGESTVNESDGETLGESEFFEVNQTKEQVAAEISGFVDRQMRMLYIYTEGYDDIASASQFQEMFGIKPSEQVQVEYYNQAEHTFQITQNRKAACARVQDWYSSQFAQPAMLTH